MKKLLSVLLAVMIAFSCFSMVSFAASAAEAETVGIKLTAKAELTGSSFARFYAPSFSVEDAVNGYLTRNFTVYNPTDQDVKVMVYFQSGWTTFDSTIKSSSSTQIIPGYSKLDFTISVPVASDGTITGTSYNVTSLTLRIDGKFSTTSKFAKGNELYVTADADEIYGQFDGSAYWTLSKITELPTATKKGIKLSIEGTSGYLNSKAEVFKADSSFTGTKTVTYYAYNTSDVATGIEFKLQTPLNGGWYGPKEVSGKEVYMIPAKSGVVLRLSVPVTNGMVKFHDYLTATNTDSVDIAMEKIFLRFNPTASSSNAPIIVMANSEDDVLFTMNANFGGTQNKWAVSYVCERPNVAKTQVNGDVESEDLSLWGNIHGGSFERVEGGANGTAHSSKFIHANYKYNSIAYNLGPSIIDFPELGYNGGGADLYTIGFWAKAEDGKSGNFMLVLNPTFHHSSVEVEQILGATSYQKRNTYYSTYKSFTLTDSWQYYEFKINFEKDYLQMLKDLAIFGNVDALDINLRFDGTGEGNAFETERFNYYVDEVTIKHQPVVGYKVSAAKDITSKEYPRVNAGFTKEDVAWIENSTGDGTANTVKKGTISRTYTIYNDTDEDRLVGLNYYGGNRSGTATIGWEQINGSSGCQDYTVLANSKKTATLTFPVYEFTDGEPVVVITDKNKPSTYNGVVGYAPLDTVFFRVDVHAGWSKGDYVIIGAPKGDVLYNLEQKTNLSYDALVELPDLVEATPTPAPTPVPTPKPLGVEFKVDETITGGYPVWRVMPAGFTTDDVVDGYIKASYDIFNTSSEEIYVTLTYQSNWTSIGVNTSYKIPAYSKKTFDISVAVNADGKVVYKNQEYDISTLSFRMHLEPNSYMEAGTSFIVAADVNDVLFKLDNGSIQEDSDPATTRVGKVSKLKVTELPDYVEATPTPVPETVGMRITAKSDISAKVYPRYNAGFTADDVVWYTDSTGDGTANTIAMGYITRTYTIYNDTATDRKVGIYYYGGNRSGTTTIGWEQIVGKSGCKDYTVPANSKYTATLSFPVYKFANGELVVAIDDKTYPSTYEGVVGYAPLNTVYFRVDVLSGWVAGDSIIIAAEEGDVLYNIEKKSNLTYEDVYVLPELTDATPQMSKEIIGAGVNVGSTLSLQYYVSSTAKASALAMRFTKPDGTIILVKECEEVDGYYKFEYKGINPQCMADEIKAELIKNDTVVDVVESYSVQQYSKNQLYKSATQLGVEEAVADALKRLVADMLVYGSESQKYTNYNTEDLADKVEGIEQYISEFKEPYTGIREITGNTDENNNIVSVGLHMANVNRIFFKLKLTDAKITFNGKTISRLALTKNDDGTYMLYSDDIYAYEFDKIHNLTLTDSKGNVIAAVDYNVSAYIANKFEEPDIASLVKAVGNYGHSANRYATIIENYRNIIPEKSSNFDDATSVSDAGWGKVGNPQMSITTDGFTGNALYFEGTTYHTAALDISKYITERGTYRISFKYKVTGIEEGTNPFNALVRTSATTSFTETVNSNIYINLGPVGSAKADQWYTYETSLQVNSEDIGVGAPWNLGLHAIKEAVTGIYIDDVVLTKVTFFEEADPEIKETETWVANEIAFVSNKMYKDPYNDVQFDVVLTNGEKTYTIPGFWDGGNTWRARFRCDEPGEWTYTTVCSDTTNKSLHDISYTFTCNEYSGDLDLYKHGFVKVVNGTKHFMYNDGTPFFYLGDTHWSLGGETADMVETITAKRVEQGYTVIQSEPLSATFNFSNGITDADMYGLAQFDKNMQIIADAGLVNVNASFFYPSSMNTFINFYGGYSENSMGTAEHPYAGTIEVFDISDDVKVALERTARYWVARYSSYPVMWSLGQEVDNDFFWERDGFNGTEHAKWCYINNPYKYLAEYIRQYDPYNSPITAHMEGTGNDTRITATNSAFRDVAAHDFYAAQWSPHLTGNSIAPVGQDFWNNGQGKPAVNYEGRYCFLWTKNFGSRAQGWMAYLSGMFGYGWGGQDTWSYQNTYSEDSDSSDGVDTVTKAEKQAATWLDSLEYDSAYQVGYMRNFFENTVGDWYNLIPRFDDTSYLTRGSTMYLFKTYKAYAAVASNKDNTKIVAYFYNFSDTSVGETPNSKHGGTLTGTFGNLKANTTYNYMWFNPITGKVTQQGTFTADSSGKWSAGSKATCDMVLYIYK